MLVTVHIIPLPYRVVKSLVYLDLKLVTEHIVPLPYRVSVKKENVCEKQIHFKYIKSNYLYVC